MPGEYGSGIYGSGPYGTVSGAGAAAGYDPAKLRLNRLHGSAYIGISLTPGSSRIGRTDDVRTDVPISACSVSEGYEVDSEYYTLSLDPATGMASFAELTSGPNPDRTNLWAVNPSFETDLAGWAVGYPATTDAVRSTDWAYSGNASMLVTALSIVAGETGTVWPTGTIDTVAGVTYTWSFRAQVAAGSATATVNVRGELDWQRPDGTSAGTDYTPVTPLDQLGATVVSLTASPPADAVRATFAVRFYSGHSVGTAVHYDAFMFEAADTVGTYIEGLAASPGWAAAALAVRDRVELTYDTTVLFQGYVTEVAVKVEYSPDATRKGRLYERRYTYTLRSIAATMLDKFVTWDDIPEEDALERLRRFATVSTDKLTAEELATITSVMVAGDGGSGSSSLIEQVRAFSAETHFALRIKAALPVRWTDLEVVGAGTPVGDAAEWATAVDWKADTGTAGTLWPAEVSVITNTDRFISGVAEIPTEGALLGTTFVVGASRVGPSYDVPVGFRAGDAVNVFGQVMKAARISTSYGRQVATTLELARPALPRPVVY